MDLVLEKKNLGNESFQKGLIEEAESYYNAAIGLLQEEYKAKKRLGNVQDDINLVHATLLSNLTMCYLKQYTSLDAQLKNHSSFEQLNLLKEPLRNCIFKTNDAIQLLDQSTLTGTQDLRSKLLYRRSKAQYHLATIVDSSKSKNEDKMMLLTKSVQDLQQLLSFDTTNKPAIQLLQHVKSYITDHMTTAKSYGEMTGTSELSKAFRLVQENKTRDSVIQALKFIHASVMDDLIDTTHQLMLCGARGLTLMVNLAFNSSLCDHDHTQYDVSALAAQILSCASAQPTFAKVLQTKMYSHSSNMDDLYQDLIRLMVQQTDDCLNSEYVTALLIIQLRFILYLHLEQDDYCYNMDQESFMEDSSLDIQVIAMMQADSASHFRSYTIQNIVDLISLVFASPCEKCKSMALNLVSAIIETNPLKTMKSTLNNEKDYGASKLKYSTSTELSEDQVRQLPPKDLAVYRRRCHHRSRLQQERARRYAIEFCSVDAKNNSHTSGLKMLLDFASQTDDSYWRRECIITIGRLIKIIRVDTASSQNEEKVQDEENKKQDSMYVDSNTKEIIRRYLSFEGDTDSENTARVNAMKKCIFVTSLLLASVDIGTWALTNIWMDAKQEWLMLAKSRNIKAMSVATELASAAAGAEGTRVWISSLVDSKSDDSIWRTLMTCSDHEVRSGAASTMAKLGLADKSISSDEGELFSLLEVASGLLYEDELNATQENCSSKALSTHSKYESSMERGVELISYLATKTFIKDEIAHGISFHGKSVDESTVLDRLVQLADPKNNVPPAVKYSITCIFASLAVSIETLKKEAFYGKEITAEQYDQMQAMSKTKEEFESDQANQEKDDPEAVKIRIMNMAKHGVPQALVHMMENASNHTLEQIVIAMMRMAVEPSIRGTMIQQGCLSACIKLHKKPTVISTLSQSSSSTVVVPKESIQEEEKKCIRYAQHTIAKLLVTTNPNSLTTSQCMGSIQPLLQLIQDADSSTDTDNCIGGSKLPIFECLLSLTNLASLNDNTKERIISEKGISIVSYCMFSDHRMIRRAATECMSNLVPHASMMEYLSHPDHLKVWVAFGMDYDDSSQGATTNTHHANTDDENVQVDIRNQNQCANAAMGCLAMVTQWKDIASVFVGLNQAEKCIQRTMMESGNLDLMHRAFVLVLNLVRHGKEDKDIQEFVMRCGVIAFCEGYFQKFSKEGERSHITSKEEEKGMMITLDLAQEILQVFYQ